MKFLPGFFKGPPESNDPFGRALPQRVLNATVRLIGERHGELSPSVSLTYQIYAVGAKRSSYQAQSRMAWL